MTTQDCVPSVTAFPKLLRDVTPSAVETSALFHELSTSRASHLDRHAEDVNKVPVPARVRVMLACCRWRCLALISPLHISIIYGTSFTLYLPFAQLSEILLWAMNLFKRGHGLRSRTTCLFYCAGGAGSATCARALHQQHSSLQQVLPTLRNPENLKFKP